MNHNIVGALLKKFQLILWSNGGCESMSFLLLVPRQFFKLNEKYILLNHLFLLFFPLTNQRE